MESSLFDDVGDAVRGLLPPELGDPHLRAHRYGIKIWFGPVKPTREHYEAQVIGARDWPAATVLALEVGFHCEHPKEPDNEAVLTRLASSERSWRRDIGKEAQAGVFLGRAEHWRRISEVWPDPDLSEPGLALEIASRLVDYIAALEPRLRAR